MKTKKALTALLLFALMGGITFAETAILFPLKDNTLYLDPFGQVSNGQGIYLFAGMTQHQLSAPRIGRVRSLLHSGQRDRHGGDSFHVLEPARPKSRTGRYLGEQSVARLG